DFTLARKQLAPAHLAEIGVDEVTREDAVLRLNRALGNGGLILRRPRLGLLRPHLAHERLRPEDLRFRPDRKGQRRGPALLSPLLFLEQSTVARQIHIQLPSRGTRYALLRRPNRPAGSGAYGQIRDFRSPSRR